MSIILKLNICGATNHADADEGEVVSCRNRSCPRESKWEWLVAYSESITPLVILDEGTVDRSCYMNNVLPVALKREDEAFGDSWIFQQDSANLTPTSSNARMVVTVFDGASLLIYHPFY